MYAQVAIKPNPLLRNGAYGIVMRGVQKCTRGCSSLRGRNKLPLCCIKLDTATDLGCGKGDLLSHLNGKLALQFGLLLFAFLDALRNHIHGLSTLQDFPEIFDGSIGFLDGRFDPFDGGGVLICFADICYGGGDPLNVAVGQQFTALQHNAVFDLFLVDHFLFALAAFEIVAGVVVIRLA